MRMRVMSARALPGRMEAGGGVDVAAVVADAVMAARIRWRRKLRHRRFCRRQWRLSSRGTKTVRCAKIVDHVKTVAGGMAGEIAVEEMTVETAEGGIALLLVRIVEARNVSRMGLSRSRLFCRVSRCRSIGVETMLRRSRWPRSLRR